MTVKRLHQARFEICALLLYLLVLFHCSSRFVHHCEHCTHTIHIHTLLQLFLHNKLSSPVRLLNKKETASLMFSTMVHNCSHGRYLDSIVLWERCGNWVHPTNVTWTREGEGEGAHAHARVCVCVVRTSCFRSSASCDSTTRATGTWWTSSSIIIPHAKHWHNRNMLFTGGIAGETGAPSFSASSHVLYIWNPRGRREVRFRQRAHAQSAVYTCRRDGPHSFVLCCFVDHLYLLGLLPRCPVLCERNRA